MRNDAYVLLAVTVADTLKLLQPVIQAMEARGWRVRVVCDVRSNPDLLHSYSDIDVICLPMSRAITPMQDAQALVRWVRLLRRELPDVVIGSTPKAGLLSMVASRVARTPVRIFQVRGARWDGLGGRRGHVLRRMDRLAAACSTDVVAVSRSLADLFLEEGITKDSPKVIGRGGSKGVDLQRFAPVTWSAGRFPTLGFVGRLSKDKGIADVLTVFESCRTTYPDCRLLVLGPVDAAQPIDATTQKRLDQPGVEWLGAVPDVESHMPHFDVLIFPSIREGLPNVVIEAAACGVPTVGYDTTGVRDAIDDGTTGALVPLGDVPALTHAAMQLLDPTTRAPMSLAARKFASEHFAEDVVVGEFVDYVETLLEQQTRPIA